jgi:hypothetical protein
MSKEELRKYHNKYLLWHKLHPKQGFERCRFCKHSRSYYQIGRKELMSAYYIAAIILKKDRIVEQINRH